MFGLSRTDVARAWSDLRGGVELAHVWGMLGWQEVRLRYRRSTLGPLWLTMGTGVLVLGMGPLYGKLLNQDLSAYLPFLTVGLVVWNLFAALMNDSCNAFIHAEAMIKQVQLPLSMHALRVVWKNVIIFAHNLIVLVAVLAIIPQNWGWNVLLLPVSFALILLNAWWVGIFLGMAGARFRDISPIVASVVTIMFFLTPVLFPIEQLGRYRLAGLANPIYHFVEIMRAPLLGRPIAIESWMVVVAVTVFGWVFTFLLFSRFRKRVAYWV
jgi:lipopolysaccharide transport system permease protein